MGKCAMSKISEVRPSPIAGRWYAADPVQLTRQIDRYLSEAVLPSLTGKVLGVITPHAGHRYSGKTAGHAFKAVMGQSFDLVVVASPLHGFHPAPFLTSAHQRYATPLGEIEVDQAAITQLDSILEQKGGIPLTPVAYDDEHSLEIELPFLQRSVRGPFKLLPVMIRTLDLKALQTLGSGLAEIARTRNCLLVASTDLSHFYDEVSARIFDREMIKRFASLDPAEVLSAERHGVGFACGAGAVAAVLTAARELGANHVEILDYSTSAAETGDTSSVVGYCAAALLKRE